MSLWETRFRQHPLWDTVDQLRETMDRVDHPHSASDREALVYAGMVLELLERRREDTDPASISPHMLGMTASAASNFSTYLDGITTGSYGWQQVISAVDEVVTSLGQWPPMKIAHWLSGLSRAIESFQAKTSDAVDRTEQQAVALEGELSKLAEQVSKLGEEVSEERQRLTEAIAKFTADGQEAVQELIDEQKDRISASEAEWAAHLAHQRSLSDEHNSRMAEYEQRSIKVLEAVGTNSTATDYGTYAHTQHKAANRWRVIASVVFAFAGAWFIASSFSWFTDGAATWESSLSRLGVTAAVAGVGAYAARESSQHRNQERDAKKVQLVLIALEPFIANLPENTQNNIRAEAARAIFVLSNDTESDGPTTSPVLDAVAQGAKGKQPVPNST